jgi:hypothetical protein
MANMTVEQLYDNYEFKVLRRIILKKFPWIKDVYVKQDELNRFSLIFLHFEIDPEEAAKAYGFELAPYIMKRWKRPEEYDTPFLSLLSTEFSLDDHNEKVAEPLLKTFREVHNSPALPEELKLPDDRKLYIGGFIFNKGEQTYYY